MSVLQYHELLKFIQLHHGFGRYRNNDEKEFIKVNYPNLNPDYGLSIKYVNSMYDTRIGRVWGVTLTSLGGVTYEFRTNSLIMKGLTPEYENLYDCVMAYLTGNLKNSEIFKEERA